MASDEEGTPLSLLESSYGNSLNTSTSGIFEDSDSFPWKKRGYTDWSPMEEGVTLVWNDLSVYVRKKVGSKVTCKRIINNEDSTTSLNFSTKSSTR